MRDKMEKHYVGSVQEGVKVLQEVMANPKAYSEKLKTMTNDEFLGASAHLIGVWELLKLVRTVMALELQERKDDGRITKGMADAETIH